MTQFKTASSKTAPVRAATMIALSALTALSLTACAEAPGQGRYSAYESGVAAHVEEGEVVSFRPVAISADNSGTGAVVGGVTGAVVGSQFGGRRRDHATFGIAGPWPAPCWATPSKRAMRPRATPIRFASGALMSWSRLSSPTPPRSRMARQFPSATARGCGLRLSMRPALLRRPRRPRRDRLRKANPVCSAILAFQTATAS